MKSILFFILSAFLLNPYAIAKETMCYAESPTLINLNCDRKSTWSLGLGVEMEYGFKADGSKEKEFEIEPGAIFHLNIGDWNQFFFNGQEAGVRTFPNRWVNLMLGARLEPGREEAADPVLLKGQGDSDDKVMGRTEFRINLYKDWRLWTGVSSLLGDSDIGYLHIFFIGYSFKDIGPLDIDLLVYQRYGSSAFINKDFGVDAKQRANSGNALYSADSGTQSSGASVTARYNVTSSVTFLFEAEYDKYASRLSASPIIQKGRNDEYEIGATVLYVF
jgi:outer membrane scaffolding protein for murein synthesis (MipA/OmpV family)